MWKRVELFCMAHLVQHSPRSPFWYLRKRDPDSGKWVESSTNYRIDDAAQTRKAQRMAEKAGISEGGATTISPAFSAWVPEYLQNHYANKSPATRKRMQIAWQCLHLFLNGIDVTYPRQVKYRHGEEYLEWRKKIQVHRKQLAGHNTALLEIKFLSQLIQEAIRREFCESNPLAKLGIGKVTQKSKPELTDSDIAKIRKHLANKPPWMLACFEISLHTGCRFNETALQSRDINLDSSTLKIRDSKRKATDPRKFFSVPILDGLRPVLERIISGKLIISLSDDKNGRINREFANAGVDATFHSLRVTYVTRLHRAGVSMTDAMVLVNHSSQLIHKIYSRLNVDDVRSAQLKIQIPSP